MAYLRITPEEAQKLLAARNNYNRKAIKRQVWADVRRRFGIPNSIKFKVAIEAPDNPLYCVLKNKHTNVPLDDGHGAEAPKVTLAAGASPALPQNTVAKQAVKVQESNAPTKKASKPAAVKASAKKAAPKKAAPKAADPLAGKDFPCDLRVTIGGKRVRLGQADSLAHAKKLIAKYKRQHDIA